MRRRPAASSRLSRHSRDADIQVWCRVCGAQREAPDLIAASRAADSMYVEWRRLTRTGLRHTQDARRPLYERTRLFKVYCSTVVPGFLQTPAYAGAMLLADSGFHATPDDVEDAVRARMSRNRIVQSPGHQFAMVIEEAVLRYRLGGARPWPGSSATCSTPSRFLGDSRGDPVFRDGRPMWTLETSPSSTIPGCTWNCCQPR